jgi:predicted small lipoprotein YifL
MRVPQYARRSLVVAALSLALAACGKESGPTPFDPQGTSADMAAAQDAFAAQQTASFAAIGPDISAVMNGSALVASSAALALNRPSEVSATLARRLVSLLPRSTSAIQASVVAIPTGVLGTTFVWGDTSYVASDLPGAPSNGVRFVLYAIDPISYRPALPLVEVGYVDIIDQSTATSIDIRVRVVQANVVYLDYDVATTGTVSGGVITVSGFASNGVTRADFTLKNTFNDTSGGLVISLDYDINVPSRGLSVNWTATSANVSSTDVAVTLDLSIAGPNGHVRLVGTFGASGGAFTVKVNGDPFATITLNGTSQVITDPNGDPLTPEEEAALRTIFDYFEQSQVALTELLAPV